METAAADDSKMAPFEQMVVKRKAERDRQKFGVCFNPESGQFGSTRSLKEEREDHTWIAGSRTETRGCMLAKNLRTASISDCARSESWNAHVSKNP